MSGAQLECSDPKGNRPCQWMPGGEEEETLDPAQINRASKTGQGEVCSVSGKAHLSEESPPGLSDIGSTAAILRRGSSCVFEAGVFVHVFTLRRKRLWLLC